MTTNKIDWVGFLSSCIEAAQEAASKRTRQLCGTTELELFERSRTFQIDFGKNLGTYNGIKALATRSGDILIVDYQRKTLTGSIPTSGDNGRTLITMDVDGELALFNEVIKQNAKALFIINSTPKARKNFNNFFLENNNKFPIDFVLVLTK